MTIKELRSLSGMTQHEFADYFDIPFRSIQNWEGGQRNAPDYVTKLIEYKLLKEVTNVKQIQGVKFIGEFEKAVTKMFNGETLYLRKPYNGEFLNSLHNLLSGTDLIVECKRDGFGEVKYIKFWKPPVDWA
jgi:transcriptional regulator with XRE-family HTH domain